MQRAEAEESTALRAAVERQSAAAAQQRAFLRDILRSLGEGRLRLCQSDADLPAPLPLASEPLPLTLPSLRILRRVTQGVAEVQKFSSERWQDLVAGVGEAAMNAVVHGGRGAEAWVCAGGGRVQVWVRDRGAGIELDHLLPAISEQGGYAIATDGSLGHGFWLMLRTCDTCWLLTGSNGTTVVLEQARP